jgi:transcription antitermination factor NusA-like protein
MSDLSNNPLLKKSVKDAIQPAEFFSVRQQQADYEKFDAIMNRSGGQAPIKGDVIDEE